MDKFICARQALAVQIVAPFSPHVSHTTCPTASTNHGVPNKAASMNVPLLHFLPEMRMCWRNVTKMLEKEIILGSSFSMSTELMMANIAAPSPNNVVTKGIVLAF
eukprot:11720267-Ditylum_brightwellii.AAC.1